jgi:hypothetical protein
MEREVGEEGGKEERASERERMCAKFISTVTAHRCTGVRALKRVR